MSLTTTVLTRRSGVSVVVWLLTFPGWGAAQPAIQQNLDVRIPMRDGVHLSANVFRPAGSGRLPVLLVRTPYGKGAGLSATNKPFVENGYAVVVQDVRGRYQSEGEFKPLEQEGDDGEDTLNWIARQRWSNGRIGMMGGSYLGIVQWKAAVRNIPHLKAIFPVVSGYDDYRDRFYSTGGAMKLGNRLLWMALNFRAPGEPLQAFDRYTAHLPLRTADWAATGQRVEMFQDALEHPAYDSFWKSISTRERLSRIRVPVFSVGGWYDNFVQSDLEAFAGLASVRRAAIGPWPHNMSVKFAEADFGAESTLPVRKLQMEWFDYWLKSGQGARKDAPGPPGPTLRIFVMGVNRWREESAWPPERAVFTPLYLTSTQGANSAEGDGVLRWKPAARSRSDRFVYDPRNPVPTRGGSVCCNPKYFPWGPLDQRHVEARQDVLVYSTAPLRKEIEVTGPIRVILYISTSAPDTDFTAKLLDVFPDGAARLLTDGILRLRYREGIEKAAAPAVPEETYRLEIDAGVTSNVFLAGHRIRIEISSSNFPRFDRNPNTGRLIANETQLRTAAQTIHHGAAHPSHVLLPLVDAGEQRAGKAARR